LLAAHFFRAGAPIVVALTLAVLALLAVPRWWAARLVQAVLLLGAVEWLVTILYLSTWRVAAGQPVVRFALILGLVAVFTAASAFVFRADRVRAFYGLGREQGRIA
jgi:hypothetical protein